MSYINRPEMGKDEMDKRLADIRDTVGKKMNAWADRLQVSMAFTPKVERIEGEQWTEDGRTYVMKNGIKTGISVTQAARMPHWCPRCEKSMSHRFDRKFYFLRGWCYNCNVEIEGQMRLDGTWDKFEREHTRANEIAWIKDKIEGHLVYIKEFKEPTVYFEDGRWEVIATKDQFQGTFDELLADVEFLMGRLEYIENEAREEEVAHADAE